MKIIPVTEAGSGYPRCSLALTVEAAKSPPCEKLVGDLEGKYSRRINIYHRIVYKVLESECMVVVFRMWTHYEQ